MRRGSTGCSEPGALLAGSSEPPAQKAAHHPAHGTTGHPALYGGAAIAAVLVEGVRQDRERHRLQPDAARACQLGQEESVAAEDLVLDAGHGRDAELHGVLEEADVTGMHPHHLALGQVKGDDLPGQLDPGTTLTVDPLQDEAVPAEDPGAEALLEPDPEVDTLGSAEEAVAMGHEAHARLRCHVDREDRPGHLGREGDHSRLTRGGVLAHEDRAAGHGPLENAADATTTTRLGGGPHLDRCRHPL